MLRNVSRSVVVDLRVERAYQIWSDFTRFPLFMRHVEEVRVEGERLHWKTVRGEWEAVVTERTPHQRVSWRRLDGPGTHAVVSLAPDGADRAKVTLGAEYEVRPGEADDRGSRYEQILDCFKTFAEQGGPVFSGAREWPDSAAQGTDWTTDAV